MTVVAARPRTRRTGWRGPTKARPYPTLGWVVLDWMFAHLPSPADPSQPLLLTHEQANIVLRWYELDPDTGEYVNRRGRLEMAKGWGKSPLLAAIALAEFAGPVVFAGWDARGEPVGDAQYWPVVEVAAVSEDQTDNTWAVVYQYLTANDGKAAKALGIDFGLTRMYLTGDRPGTMRPVTAKSASREGARLTFAVLDETHLWYSSNGGTKLAATLRRNAAKMNGRTFETTNAPILGLKSVAEESGTADVAGVLHVRVQPSEQPRPDMDKARAQGAAARGLRRLHAGCRSTGSCWRSRTRPRRGTTCSASISTSARAGKSRAVDPRTWDELERPREVPPGARIALGFDGSLSLDSTVLRACTDDGYRFSLPGWSWVRPTGDDMRAWAAAHPGEDWKVPRDEVDDAVA